jgi:error-prone DNA polymerase
MRTQRVRGRPKPRSDAPAYAELQVTTNFTFLAGGSHAEELVATAKALGLAAIAVTDRNTLAGVARAYLAAKEADMRLIVGARLDLTDAPSLICLPTDRAAYGRLSQLLTLGQRRAAKGECLIGLTDVAAHAQGQIFLALPAPDWDWRELSEQKRRDPSLFAASLVRMRQALAPAPLYLAASHRYCGEDRARIAALASLAGRCGTPLVATNDVLYHAPHRRPLQDVLSAIREKCTVAEAGLRLEANAERHLKAPREMARLFRCQEDAMARTLEIMAACTFSLKELVYEYPDEPIPPGKTPQGHLEDLTREGTAWRYPDGVPDKIAAVLRKELDLIAQLKYAPYFLTVHDIVHFARAQGILCQGRGSAANSAVCYVLGITSVNPVEVDLLFERFISPERQEPPDIDVDFEHERREEVIQYIYARYGRERAGLAATVISYRARSAVREVGKAMGLSQDTVAALSGMVWGTRSGGVLPEKHIREAGLDPADPRLARVIELTHELMGFPRHLSQHVGGFVLTRGPLSEVVPIGNAAMENRTNIEWDKDDLDAMGLLKVDVLGLGMLTCIRKGFDLLARHYGIQHTLGSIPREDPAVYDMLCRADSVGVFQVESRAQMNMLPRLKPRCFYDLVIEVAIVRPGPIQGDMVHPYLRRRDGIEPETYPSPDPAHGPPDELRQILGKTKGVPLFQEQAMRIAMEAAKFSSQEANELRRAMATFRRKGTIHTLEDKMVSRMVARGYTTDFAQRCFNQIKGFGDYGFPESHAASFALLVYVSSWLKCHYPAVFAAALLNSQPMGFYAPAQIVRDAREHGVTAREADVNHSDWDSTLEPDGHGGWALRLGLRQIDGLREEEVRKIAGLGTWDSGLGFATTTSTRVLSPQSRVPPPRSIPANRSTRYPHSESRVPSPEFRTIPELRSRSGIATTTLERLAAADAFRSMGLDRRQALWEVRALPAALPLPLFHWADAAEMGADAAVALPEMALSEHVVNDYQTLRLSLKAHPMSFLRAQFRRDGVAACADLRQLPNGVRVSIAGVILIRQRPGTAKGVVFMTLEDETGVANAVIWPQVLERYRKVVMGARLVLIRGRMQRHDNIIHLIAEHLEDRSSWLLRLAEDAPMMPVPLANADEVLRPEPGSARGALPEDGLPHLPPQRTHPRNVRILPKSRDFH